MMAGGGESMTNRISSIAPIDLVANTGYSPGLDDSVARKVAQAAKAPLPLGIINAQDVSRMPK